MMFFANHDTTDDRLPRLRSRSSHSRSQTSFCLAVPEANPPGFELLFKISNIGVMVGTRPRIVAVAPSSANGQRLKDLPW